MTFRGSHGSEIFLTFIIGALVGAGVALLWAPQTGAKTRGVLRDRAARAKDEVGDPMNDAAHAWESATGRGEEFVEKGKESLREAGRQATELVDSGEKALHEAEDLAEQHL